MSAHAHARLSTLIPTATLAVAVGVCSSSGLAQGTPYVIPTDSMTGSRSSAATAVLEDGSILIAGQDTRSGVSERYDPTSERFVAAGALVQPRSEAGAVRLADGRVLVLGGWDGAAASSNVDLFDPATGTFAPGGHMGAARVRAAVARLEDGRVLIAGGHDGRAPLTSAELYDPRTGEFTFTASMQSARAGTATLLSDATVLIVSADDGTAGSAELFDPVSQQFRTVGGLNIPRSGHAVTFLADGRVLITGGRDVEQRPIAEAEVYDPAAESFAIAARLFVARLDHAAVRIPDGRVLVVGGRNDDGAVRSLEIYDPATAAFTPEASLIEARVTPITAALENGAVLIAGGRGTNGGGLASAELYRGEDRRHETSTVLVASLPSSTYGQAVSYMAAVSSAAGTPSGLMRFFDGDLWLGDATIEAGRAMFSTATMSAGAHSIRAVYAGSTSFRPSESPIILQTVARAAATGSLSIAPIQRQYSDPVRFVATVSPATAAQSVTFKIGATVLGVAEIVEGRATFDTTVLPSFPPGTQIVTAVFNQGVPNYLIANVAKSMSIIREDARVTTWHDTLVYTACPTCTIAKVLLKATVRDISATSEANGDVSPGDIRNATLTFINRATYGMIANVPVTLPDPNDLTTGEAVYEWTIDLGGAASKTFKVGYGVTGLYTRSTYEYVAITVSKPK